jgi:hypothetical protein
MAKSTTTCPSCGAHKGIRKLSVIVQAQEDPALIRRIAPPMDPQKAIKNLSSRDMLVVIALAFVMTVFFLAMQERATTAMIIYGAFMLFMLAALVRLFLHYSRTRKTAAALAEPWREAYLVWARLWYCYDEDLVFDPRTGESAKPEAMREQLLHYTGEIVTGKKGKPG